MKDFLHNIGSLPRAFWVLAGATFVTRFGVFVLPFLTLFMTNRGFTGPEAGWAVAAYAAGGFAAAGVGGWLADRIGRNVTMALSSLLGAGCMMMLSGAESLGWLVALAGLAGFVSEAGGPASSALVQDLVPPPQRVAAYAVLRWAINLGWAFGPAVAGFVAKKSFFWLFVGDAVTSALFGLVALFFLPKGQRTHASAAGWGPALASIRRNRPFLALFAACVALSILFRQTTTSFTLHFPRSGLTEAQLGLALGLNGALICVFELPFTALTRGWRTVRTLAFGYALMGLSFLLLLTGPQMAVMCAFITLFTCGEMLAFSRQQAYAAGLAPEEMRGRYSGFLSIAWSIGNVAGATFGLWLYEISSHTLWIVCGALGLAAAAVIMTGSKARRAEGGITS